MSDFEATSPPAGEAETFCLYLTKHLIVDRGFEISHIPEAAAIAAQSDVVLSLSDGYSLTIAGLIDRELEPGKAFTLTPDELEEIGRACLQYTGRVNGVRLPVIIHLMEVGPGDPDQQRRLAAIRTRSWFSRVISCAWTIDPARRLVWTTATARARHLLRYIRGLVAAPRRPIVARPPVAVAPRGFPWLTAAILVALAAVFAGEIAFGIGAWDGLLQPGIPTLLAFGGLSRNAVLQGGEWYRLLCAPFLHVDAGHLAMNAIAIGIAGYVLESVLGRAWFAAVYAVGATGGALLSLLLNPDNIVSVGASGAGMALFAAMLAVSLRFPPGATRAGLQGNAMGVLIPSLLPLASALKGIRVDYAAHFGGAIAGALVALIALSLWRRDEPHPRWRAAALAVAIAGAGGAIAAAMPVVRSYPTYVFTTALVPPAQMPTSDAAARAQSADLIARYPRDPRMRLLRASVLLQANDLTGAERELRAGLAEEAVWRPLFTADLPTRLRTLLALLLASTGRADEGREVARPACEAVMSGPGRELLDRQKLCTK